jgi:hypothetical protein
MQAGPSIEQHAAIERAEPLLELARGERIQFSIVTSVPIGV